MSRALLASALLLGALNSPSAMAQSPFRAPGNVELLRLPDGHPAHTPEYFATGSDGWVYYRAAGLPVSCWHEDSGAQDFGPFPPVPGNTRFLSHDGRGLFLAGDDGTRIVVYYGRCADPKTAEDPPPTPVAVVDRSAITELGADPLDFHSFVETENGQLCFVPWSRAGAYCFDPGDDEPSVVPIATAATLDAAYEFNPTWVHDLFIGEHTPVSYTMGPLAPLPGGDLAVLVTRQLANQSLPLAVRYLFRMSPAGDFLGLIHSPAPVRATRQSKGFEPFGDPDILRYHSALDALVLGPVQDWDWADWEVVVGRESAPAGFTGLGFRVIDLTGPVSDVSPGGVRTSGYFSVSDAIAYTDRCSQAAGPFGQACDAFQARATAGPGDEVWLQFAAVTVNPATNGAHRVSFDIDALDLDADGVAWGEEQAAGTSDFRRDSDHGGDFDSVELRLGGDPMLRTDDHTTGERVHWSLSPLIQIRSPFESAAAAHPPFESFGSRGPWCNAMRCTGPDGEPFAPPGLENLRGISIDGTYFVAMKDGALQGHVFHGSASWSVLPAEALADLKASHRGVDPRHIIPVDRESVWLVWEDEPSAAIHVNPRTGVIKAVWDGPTEAAAVPTHPDRVAALAVDDTLAPQRLQLHIEVIGYNEDLDVLVFQVGASWDRYMVAVGEDLPPTVILRGASLHGQNRPYFSDWAYAGAPGALRFPEWMRSDGQGHYLTNQNFHTAAFGVEKQNKITGIAGLQTNHHIGAWGDTILAVQSRGIPQDGQYEWVRYTQSVERGHLFWLVPDLELGRAQRKGFQLRRVGPRGGDTPVWEEGMKREIMGPTGMRVAEDGRVCIADRDQDTLFEYGPVGGLEGPPAVLTASGADLGGIIDCAYDDTGALLVLLTDPPRVARWADGSLEDLETLDGEGAPIQLHVSPTTGERHIVYAWGGGFGNDGEWIEVEPASPEAFEFIIKIDGEEVGRTTQPFFVDGLLAPIACANDDPVCATPTGADVAFHVVHRPDGLIALNPYWPLAKRGEPLIWQNGQFRFEPPYRLMALDPSTGKFAPLTLPQHWSDPDGVGLPRAALARIPGGQRLDPWTHEPVGPQPSTPMADGDPSDPPMAPRMGTPIPGEADDGCDCRITSRGADGPILLFALLLLMRRRRAA